MAEQTWGRSGEEGSGRTGPDDGPITTKRRAMLKLAAIGGGFGAIPPGVAAGKPGSPGEAASNGGVVQLGDFESGLDGWKTNGGNGLTRVTAVEVPMGVTSGQHGLAVEVNGDLFPMIENKKRVKDAAFLANPYLHVHVLAVAEETDSDLLFRFRLHHKPAGGRGGGKKKGKKGGGSPGSKDVNVVGSELIPVPQLRPRRIQWDMTGLAEDVQATVRRLEIRWYPRDGGSRGGRREEAEESLGFSELVVFDDVRLSASEPISDAERLQQKRLDLHREHGAIVDREIVAMNETVERGRWEYADGYKVSYTFEVLSEDRFRYTIEGDSFYLGNRTR